MKTAVGTARVAMAARMTCCAATMFGSLAGPVVADEPASPVSPTTAAPAYKVGDTWTFSVSATNRNSGAASLLVESVVGVADDQTTLRAQLKGAPPSEIYFNSQGDAIRDGSSTYEPAQGLLDFPLTVGKSWDVREVRHWNSGWNQVVSAHATVEAFENVQVGAGTFDAYKIFARGLNKGQLGGSASRFDITYWYAPSAKRIVKYVYEWTSYLHLENYTYELATYSLAP